MSLFHCNWRWLKGVAGWQWAGHAGVNLPKSLSSRGVRSQYSFCCCISPYYSPYYCCINSKFESDPWWKTFQSGPGASSRQAGLPNVRVSNCLKFQGEFPNARNLWRNFQMPEISRRVSKCQKSKPDFPHIRNLKQSCQMVNNLRASFKMQEISGRVSNRQTYQGELSNCQKSQREIPNARNLRESFHMPDISGKVS